MHTPGPYVVELDLIEAGDINVVSPDPHAPRPLALIDVRDDPEDTDSPPREVALANANLFAAAPELLHFAKWAQQMCDGPLGLSDPDLRAAVSRLAGSVIAKAEGR